MEIDVTEVAIMPAKRQALGRGLDALFSTSSERPDRGSGALQLPIEQIIPNPRQPRTVMDSEKLAELAASIKVHGLIQPLIVTETVEGYVLIAGERQQPDQIGDRRAGLAHALGHFFLCQTKLIDELPVGICLLQRIQIRPLDVFDECQFQHILRRGFFNDDRHTVQPR